MAFEAISLRASCEACGRTQGTAHKVILVRPARSSACSRSPHCLCQGLPGASEMPFHRSHMACHTPCQGLERSEGRAEVPPESCLSEM